MNLTEDEVLQVLRLLEDSSYDELDLQLGEMRLRVRRKGAPVPAADACAPEPARSRETPAAAQPVAPSTAPPAAPADADVGEEGLVPIVAPMVGTFFVRPSPNEPPFVEVGADLEAEDTVCLLEVMKVFNTVKAGVRGRVVKVCAENAQFVEYGQTLFLVRPEDDSGVSQAP